MKTTTSGSGPHGGQKLLTRGPAPKNAKATVLLIHGRGGTAELMFGFADFFGRDDIPFEHTWEGTPTGWTRAYPGFTAMANEVAESRIYAGFHFRFDNVAGQSVGRNVANYVFLNFMRPRHCDF